MTRKEAEQASSRTKERKIKCLVWDLDNTMGDDVIDDGFELRSSVGVSIFWATPIGPLRLNFARPIEQNPLDETRSFDITISTQF